MNRKVTLLFTLIFAFIILAGGGSIEAQDFDLGIEAAILVDAETGQVLYEKNADKKLPPASITKIMTLLLTMERVESGAISYQDEITISKFAESMGGSQIYLAANTRVKLEDLLKSIAIASANDACVAIAEGIYGSENGFVNKMNQRAKELGMRNTYFANTTGLPPDRGEHYSTARDISYMARELLKHPHVLDWTSTWVDYVQLPNRKAMLVNTNRLVNKYPGMDGLKTGHTDAAGFSLVGTAKRGDMRLISVVLKADSEQGRGEATARLLDYGFNSFSRQRVIEKGEQIQNIEVPMGKKTLTTGETAENLDLILLKGSEDEVTGEVKIEEPLQAPIKKGEIIGRKIIYQDEKELGVVNIIATEDIEKANIFVRLWRAFVNWIGSLLEKI